MNDISNRKDSKEIRNIENCKKTNNYKKIKVLLLTFAVGVSILIGRDIVYSSKNSYKIIGLILIILAVMVIKFKENGKELTLMNMFKYITKVIIVFILLGICVCNA